MAHSLLQAFYHQALTASMEQVSTDGREREYVFFGQMVDKSDLEKITTYEDQIQYRIMVPAKEKDREISVRIRKTIKWKDGHCDDPVYTLTIKSFVKGEEGCAEAESVIPPEQGELYVEIFRANGSDGLIKRRYFFPLDGTGYWEGEDEKVTLRLRTEPGAMWEVDVPKEFPTADQLDRSEVGDGNSWVKLDLEVKEFNLKVTDTSFSLPFPIRLKNVVYQQPGKRSKEAEATVKKALSGFKPTDM
jgi:hypothetical protein